MVNHSATTSSTKTTQAIPTETPTAISRLLCLRSDQANLHYSPTDKMWEIPPIDMSPDIHHVVTIRSLRIYHLFPSVRTAKTLKTPGRPDVDIFTANWDAPTLANYLSAMLEDVRVTFDYTDLRFYFDPPLEISEGTTAHRHLGLATGFVGEISRSHMPVKLSCPQAVYVYSNLSASTIPPSGLLGTVPITVPFGDLISYQNDSNDNGVMCTDQSLRNIRITLSNENGRDLCPNVDEVDNYNINDEYMPVWEIILNLEPVKHDGYSGLVRSEDMALILEGDETN